MAFSDSFVTEILPSKHIVLVLLMVRAPGLEPGFRRWQRPVITTTLRSQYSAQPRRVFDRFGGIIYLMKIIFLHNKSQLIPNLRHRNIENSTQLFLCIWILFCKSSSSFAWSSFAKRFSSFLPPKIKNTAPARKSSPIPPIVKTLERPSSP